VPPLVAAALGQLLFERGDHSVRVGVRSPQPRHLGGESGRLGIGSFRCRFRCSVLGAEFVRPFRRGHRAFADWRAAHCVLYFVAWPATE
jgi:hypothetical protein